MIKDKYHFIGIGGIGMSGLARLLLKKNTAISGSDAAASYVTEALVQEGATVYIGHEAKQVPHNSIVVYSTGISQHNPEYCAAMEMRCDVLHRSDLLHQLTQGHKTLAVAGTHGKTTTSALLAWVLESAGLDPSFAIGGMVLPFESNAKHGQGAYFAIEACESDGTFLKYTPFGAIVTNIDSDHLDHYGSKEKLIEAFQQFIERVDAPELLFWCGDDADLQQLMPQGISYGFSDQCDLRVANFRQQGWQTVFDVNFRGDLYKNITLSLLGKHNVLNAAAVFGLALSLGIDEHAIRQGLLSFKGVKRRCELKGNWQSIEFIDDYAHHPTEIKATLEGLRAAIGERRLVVIYQPHRYTRTQDTCHLYGPIFDAADLVLITDIYAAGEAPIPGVTSHKLLEIVAAEGNSKTIYMGPENLVANVFSLLQPHDVVVTMGAGNITALSKQLIAHLD